MAQVLKTWCALIIFFFVCFWPVVTASAFLKWEEPADPAYHSLPMSLNISRVYGNGTCVPYARIRTGIALYGWAGSFLGQAGDFGYATGTTPMVGAIMATSEGNGHVAVVEAVTAETVTVSEQNLWGLYVVSERELALSDSRILGYIYPHVREF